MAVKIYHAVMDENGSNEGPQLGDQTGKEINSGKWYAQNSKGEKWTHYLYCTDARMREEALRYIIAITDNPNFGYSQGKTQRWSGYKSILANGKVVNGAKKGDFDCSTLIISCFIFAGLNIPPSGYTGSIESTFKATGKFEIYTTPEYTTTDNLARRGGVYLRNGHVLMVAENGSGATSEVTTGAPINKPASDYTVLGYLKVDNLKSWCNVRVGPDTTYALVGRAYKNEVYAVIGQQSGWYMINYKGNVSFISGEFVTRIEHNNVTSGVVTITGGKVNVRKGPATTYPIVAVVYKGNTFGYLGETTINGWYKISRNGTEVYVSGALSKLG